MRGEQGPGTYTFTYGRESVTLDVTLPRPEWEKRLAAIKELQDRAWRDYRAADAKPKS